MICTEPFITMTIGPYTFYALTATELVFGAGVVALGTLCVAAAVYIVVRGD